MCKIQFAHHCIFAPFCVLFLLVFLAFFLLFALLGVFWVLLVAFWVPFGCLLGALGCLLGTFCALLGASWALLGSLGALLGRSWAVLGRSGGAGRCLVDFWSDFGANLAPQRRPTSDQHGAQNRPKSKTNFDIEKEALQDRLGAVLGRSWVIFGRPLGSFLLIFHWF